MKKLEFHPLKQVFEHKSDYSPMGKRKTSSLYMYVSKHCFVKLCKETTFSLTPFLKKTGWRQNFKFSKQGVAKILNFQNRVGSKF
jgi:hypothetical protein